MKNKLITLLTTVSLGLLPLLAAAQQEPVRMNNLAVTDLSVTTAFISWTTDQMTTGNKVEITSADSTWQVADSYGQPAYTHLVQIVGLVPSTEYSYKIISGETVWDNGGEKYKFSTIGFSQAGNPMIISGTLHNTWGSPVERSLIRFRLYNEYEGLSLPRVVISSQDGKWDGNLGIMFNSTATGLFALYGDDQVILEMIPNYWTSVTDSLAIQTNYGTMSIQVIDPNAYEPGDVDGNGAFNIFDLLDLLKVMSKKITPDPRMQAASDLDANGRVDVFDLLALLKKMKSTTAARS